MRTSIKTKFYIFIAALLLILLLTLNIIPVVIARDAVFEEKKNSLTVRGNTVSQALSRLEHVDSENIKEVLKLIDFGSSAIAVTDVSGNTIYNTTGSSKEAYIQDVSISLTGKTVFRSHFIDSAFFSTYVTPISFDNEICGALIIQDTDNERAEIILSLQNIIRSVTIIICILTIVVAYIFSSSLIRRFSSLTSSMRTVADGDYSHRSEIGGNDEITDLSREFNSLTEKLQETEIVRRQFVSDASHELKTPLASIRLLSDSIVQNDMDIETTKEFCADIALAAERMQHTTEKLLDLSRLDDDVRIEPVPVDLNPVIVDAYVFVNPLATERGIKIKCDLDDGCIVMSNTDDMLRVVFNLMENAVKYNVDGGKVDVILSGDDDNIYIKVIDTGIGIPEEDRLNVFSRFYRVDKARSREAGGSGLGLSIVHDTVLLYGGTITIGENKPQGSVFTITFPRASEEETGI